jgi:hypothetical protein
LYGKAQIVYRAYWQEFNPDSKQLSNFKGFPKNVKQLPLGYMTNFLRGAVNTSAIVRQIHHHNHHVRNDSIGAMVSSAVEDVNITERPYRWSFVGSVHGRGKQERETMLTVFSAWRPHFIHVTNRPAVNPNAANDGENDQGDVSNSSSTSPFQSLNRTNSDGTILLNPAQMHAVYRNSDFVLSGRGWVTLDCLRIYEAIIAGAIPVIVSADRRELGAVFGYNGRRLPAIFANSWDAALTEAHRLTPKDIARKRRQLQLWWAESMQRVRVDAAAAIKTALGDNQIPLTVRTDLWVQSHQADVKLISNFTLPKK